MSRKTYFDNPVVEKAAAAVYKDGFNIYAMVSKLKKNYGGHGIPDDVIIGVCKQYWYRKAEIKNQWTWFQQVFITETNLWISEKHRLENESYKKAPVAQSIKDIMKGMFDD